MRQHLQHQRRKEVTESTPNLGLYQCWMGSKTRNQPTSRPTEASAALVVLQIWRWNRNHRFRVWIGAVSFSFLGGRNLRWLWRRQSSWAAKGCWIFIKAEPFPPPNHGLNHGVTPSLPLSQLLFRYVAISAHVKFLGVEFCKVEGILFFSAPTFL